MSCQLQPVTGIQLPALGTHRLTQIDHIHGHLKHALIEIEHLLARPKVLQRPSRKLHRSLLWLEQTRATARDGDRHPRWFVPLPTPYPGPAASGLLVQSRQAQRETDPAPDARPESPALHRPDYADSLQS